MGSLTYTQDQWRNIQNARSIKINKLNKNETVTWNREK